MDKSDYLYHYNKDNNLIKKQLFVLPENRQIYPRDIDIEYDRDGNKIKEIFKYGQTKYYNKKGQIIKIEYKGVEHSLDDSTTFYFYKSGLLIKEETHQYGRVYTTKYKYDKNRRINEIAGWDETLKYKYDKDGKLIRKDEIDDSTTVTYYHYDEGLLVREEVDFENNGIINFVQYFFTTKMEIL